MGVNNNQFLPDQIIKMSGTNLNFVTAHFIFLIIWLSLNFFMVLVFCFGFLFWFFGNSGN